MEMFHATVLSLVFLISSRALAQDFDFPVSPPSLNINPFGDGFQNSNGGLSALDNSMADISASNGVTTVSATIGGKRYTATFPGENNSIATETSIENVNGQSTEVFTITVNDETYTYKTADGRTTVTNGQGELVSDGGPFHVTSI